MFRLVKKKSSHSLFWSITFFASLCFLTAFVYYFVLIEELDVNSNKIVLVNGNSAGTIEQEINSRLINLEAGLHENREILKNIRYKLDRVVREFNDNHNGNYNGIKVKNGLDYTRNSANCARHNTALTNYVKSDICMSDVYEEVKFDDPDGGVWKQGWAITYNQSDWNKDKLQVFVVPHSHNDPGWIKTFDKYFKEQTKKILDSAVIKLTEDERLKFIWAEISYLSAWWEVTQSEDMKNKLKKLVENGQFEIVTGGWVMNDEANTHYSSMIAQMIEGHEWVAEHLNYKPKYGWAIDPFGLSPTMAFLLKKMGLKGMVIQRVHYSLKKYLASKKELEFRWRQEWEQVDGLKSDILCHVEPFYSYDVPHTCGPDPKICCQFDFKRLPPSRVKCPWKIAPKKITDNNVHERAQVLLDQYKKKAKLYRTNSLLIPLGDDFRFDKNEEWDAQKNNYLKLFEHINAQSDWNVQVKFGTLKDYFESLQAIKDFPTLSGDFFTYSDREDHYWSGYYTSKPFYKRFERFLESHLRSAEVIFSLASMLNAKSSVESLNSLLPLLIYARQNLALFQHHDAITGTAKDVVVNDYASRLFKSLENLEKIFAKSFIELLNYESAQNAQLRLIENFREPNTPPEKTVLTLNQANPARYLLMFNSLSHSKDELICVHIATNTSDLCIKDSDGILIEDVEINFVWLMDKLLPDRFEVCFISHLKPLSLSEYQLFICNGIRKVPNKLSKVELYNFPSDIEYSALKSIVSFKETPTELMLDSHNMQLKFNGADGMLRQVKMLQSERAMNWRSHDVRMNFMTYGTRSGKKGTPKSGAYLFLPDNENAQDLIYSNAKIRITKGSIVNKFELIIEKPIPLRHEISHVKGNSYFNIENEFHLGQGSFGNKELMMRFYTDIQNEDIFYTDLNGFQMIKRKRYSKIPLQGNVYPMPSMAYIQDSTSRLNILTAQPLGVISSNPGWIDIFLDRRLLQDDQRGLNQGLVDNRKTKELFKILFEPTPTEPLKPSLEAQTESYRLLSPSIIMHTNMKSTISELNFLQNALPCNIHLLNLRRSTQNEFSLFLHRFGVSCDTNCYSNSSNTTNSIHSNNDIIISKHFSPILLQAIETQMSRMSLSLLESQGKDFSIDDAIHVDDMDIAVFRIRKLAN